MSKGKKAAHQEEEEHKLESAGGMRWLLTYADMITLLLGLFIVLVASSKTDSAKWKVIAQQAERVFGAGNSVMNSGVGSKPFTGGGGILPYIKPPTDKKNKNGNVSVKETDYGTLITFTGMLYDAGSAVIKQDAKVELDNICKEQLDKYPDNLIMITGHTDDRPISTGAFPSNWELSSGRAGSVARYLMDSCGVGTTRIITSGRADTVPLAPNDSEENRAKNRRVEIQVLKGQVETTMQKLSGGAQDQPVPPQPPQQPQQ